MDSSFLSFILYPFSLLTSSFYLEMEVEADLRPILGSSLVRLDSMRIKQIQSVSNLLCTPYISPSPFLPSLNSALALLSVLPLSLAHRASLPETI